MPSKMRKPRPNADLRREIVGALKERIASLLERAVQLGLKPKEAVTAVEEAAINWEYGN